MKFQGDLQQAIRDSYKGGDRPITVYLAGGFHSGWQDRLKEGVQQFIYLDPRTHALKDNVQYTLWDTEAIRHSDLIFAYLESTNPAG